MICGSGIQAGLFWAVVLCKVMNDSFGCIHQCLDWRVLEGFTCAAGAFWSSKWLLFPRASLDFLLAWWPSLCLVGFLSRKVEAQGLAFWALRGHVGWILLIKICYRKKDTDSNWWESVRVTLHSSTWDERHWWHCLDHTVCLQILCPSLLSFSVIGILFEDLSHASCISPTLGFMTSGTYMVGNNYLSYGRNYQLQSLKAVNICNIAEWFWGLRELGLIGTEFSG